MGARCLSSGVNIHNMTGCVPEKSNIGKGIGWVMVGEDGGWSGRLH